MANEKAAKIEDKRQGLVTEFDKEQMEKAHDMAEETIDKAFNREFRKGTQFPCKIRMTKYGKIAITVFVPEKYMRKVLE